MVNSFPKQGDLVFMDAEPHSGSEIGGHLPEKGNIRRPFLILSRDSYNSKTGRVYAMAISHVHREGISWRRRFVDFDSKINGDLILNQVPMYSYHSRHGEIVGQCKDRKLMEELCKIVSSIFDL
ncbi:type II toxin-antitoxin system PemK/MazF family toxin [Lactobacillus sp. ESL0677]|uniref:type II toxin-antitoxin system PemK/MazF family toxin n=1 Tax=Lactobacillus sp. ESL0677 TaxID=2983208 RepID=UPI0023F626F6|nr:type II toxin-antitoxin system PemK/MazF family toxin [Lactobacillus sp. ESL0677]WEV37620.1 type II toxin-antitoxin system PemK/MazF family toxin [Lactobacillus sp. ESL0677]